MVGMLAKSKAGHDKDNIYVIFQEDDAYVYLVDGKSRTTDKPKKKNRGISRLSRTSEQNREKCSWMI